MGYSMASGSPLSQTPSSISISGPSNHQNHQLSVDEQRRRWWVGRSSFFPYLEPPFLLEAEHGTHPPVRLDSNQREGDMRDENENYLSRGEYFSTLSLM